MIHLGVGIIEGLNRGNGGYIRSVTVRTANGKTNRPIARLYPLEVSVDRFSVTKEPAELSHHSSDLSEEP